MAPLTTCRVPVRSCAADTASRAPPWRRAQHVRSAGRANLTGRIRPMTGTRSRAPGFSRAGPEDPNMCTHSQEGALTGSIVEGPRWHPACPQTRPSMASRRHRASRPGRRRRRRPRRLEEAACAAWDSPLILSPQQRGVYGHRCPQRDRAMRITFSGSDASLDATRSRSWAGLADLSSRSPMRHHAQHHRARESRCSGAAVVERRRS